MNTLVSYSAYTAKEPPMIDENLTFGDYLQKRRSALMVQRALADKIGVTVAYISDVENGRRDPPPYDKLLLIADALDLKGQDRLLFFDLAGKGRKEVSPDLPEYIMNSNVADTVRLALRTAKDSNASVQDWLDFVEKMKKKGQSD